ncbi:MAG: LacI family DNA-binding transcriptional regulator [Firmicutes bacterium]|nr:LacI family DNA-binding transcriptional regulator [Bacillota bacterium]
MNIYDIARLSGVSIATVSRVVNGSDKVSEKTRRKVLSVIETEGYTPNLLAQSLGQGTTHIIGIMVPELSDLFMSSCVSILESQLLSQGYNYVLSSSGFAQDKKEACARALLSRQIDALILVGSTYAGHETSDTDFIKSAAAQVPVFIINGSVKGDNIYSSVSDDQSAVYRVVTAMIRSGRRRILFLSDSRSYSANEKLAGYEQALRDASLPLLGELKIHVSSGIHEVRDFLLQYRNLSFDAVLAANDSIAVGAVKYACARGMQIPEDLVIVGYNNSSFAECCEPELSSIDNGLKEMCGHTTDRLIRVLNGEENVVPDISVPCRLVRRNTTDF